jgi:outer membrane protein OmpU
MKKVLLATTMLVGGASIAAADVTLSGTARMGLVSPFENAATPYSESDVVFTSRARVIFTLSGESDSGLSFGATFRADNAAGANAGTAGSVFISGAFGRLTMGDVDGAAQQATGHVAGVGLTGLRDLNESTFLGAGNPDDLGTIDPTAVYEYSAGDLSVFVSATSPDAVVDLTVAGPNNFVGDMQALAIGARYTFGDYTFGVGYEKLSGFTQAVGAFVPGTRDNVDLDHIVVRASANVAGFTVQGLIGQADGDASGLVTAGAAPNTTVVNNAKAVRGCRSVTPPARSPAPPSTAMTRHLGGTAAYGHRRFLRSGRRRFGLLAASPSTKVAGPDATTFDHRCCLHVLIPYRITGKGRAIGPPFFVPRFPSLLRYDSDAAKTEGPMSLAEITARVRAAERAAGRAEGSVTLIAVSKVQPLDRVVAVLEAGHRIFGENYVQEAATPASAGRAARRSGRPCARPRVRRSQQTAGVHRPRTCRPAFFGTTLAHRPVSTCATSAMVEFDSIIGWALTPGLAQMLVDDPPVLHVDVSRHKGIWASSPQLTCRRVGKV